jgi:hypothetical protein
MTMIIQILVLRDIIVDHGKEGGEEARNTNSQAPS